MNHAKETLRISLILSQDAETSLRTEGRVEEADIHRERQESFLQALALLDYGQPE